MSAVAVLALWAAAPAGAVIGTSGSSQFGFEPRDAAAPAATGNLTYHGGPVMHTNNTYAIYWDPPTPTAVAGSYDGDWKSQIDGFLTNVGHDSGSLTNGFALTSQYTDASNAHAAYNSTFRGAYTDGHSYPAASCFVGSTTCLTDAQVRTELQSFISANSLPTGMGTIYFVLTPPGVTVCTDSGATDCSDRSSSTSFCSYHSFIGTQSSPGPSTILYAVQPWTVGTAGLDVPWDGSTGLLGLDCQDGGAGSQGTYQQEPNQMPNGLDLDGDYDEGLADLVINEMSVEMVNTITNPTMNGWYDAGNSSEQSDQCRDRFSPAKVVGAPKPTMTGADGLANETINGVGYYLNNQFNLAAMHLDYPGIPCQPFVRLDAQFTIPAAVQPGDVVGFDGTESLVDMAPATYKWDFGDGTAPVSGASVYHAFATAGNYLVTLTVTDQGQNVSTRQHAILVGSGGTPGGGTPGGGTPGGGTPGGSTPGGGSTTSGGSTTTTSGGPTTTSTPTPAATHPGTSTGSGSNGPAATDATAPVIAEQILSRTLSKARRSGVAVHYRVDRASAGRFDLILDLKTATRLHIKGAHVSAGASAGVVVGSAVFGTLQGGASSLSIHFTKSAKSHLAHAHSLAVTVRFTVTSDNGRRSVVVSATTLR